MPDRQTDLSACARLTLAATIQRGRREKKALFFVNTRATLFVLDSSCGGGGGGDTRVFIHPPSHLHLLTVTVMKPPGRLQILGIGTG